MSTCQSIFVGALPSDCTQQELTTLFSVIGNVTEVSHKGKYAFVDFATPESAEAAVQLDGHPIRGKRLAIRLNTEENKVKKRTRDSTGVPATLDLVATDGDVSAITSVFVGGIPGGMAEEPIRELFTINGEIPLVERKKGFAFLQYQTPESAQQACLFDTHEIAPQCNLGVRLNTKENKTNKTTSMGLPLKKLRMESDVCSVFVGSLKDGTSEESLKACFAGFGYITKIHLKGTYAFIDFATSSEAQAACCMDGQVVEGKAMAVRLNTPENKAARSHLPQAQPVVPAWPSMVQPMIPSMYAAYQPTPSAPVVPVVDPTCRSIFVGGLNDATVDELRQLFAPCGDILKIDLKSKYAFIDFILPTSAQGACAFDGYAFKGKNLGVRLNTPENKYSQHTTAQPTPTPTPMAMPMLGAVDLPFAMPGMPGVVPPSVTTVFVGGFGSEMTDAMLQSYFSPYGRILEIRRKTGYAFIDYGSYAEAYMACRLDGFSVGNGRQLGVRINQTADTQATSAPLVAYPSMEAIWAETQAPSAALIAPVPAWNPYGAMPTAGYPTVPQSSTSHPQPSTASTTSDSTKSIFVGGFPEDYTAVQLANLFSQYGKIVDLSVKKGYAFIDFSSPWEAQAACVCNGYEVAPGKRLGVRQNTQENKSKTNRKSG